MNVVHIGTGVMSIPPRGVGAVENAIYELSKMMVHHGHSVAIIDIKSNVDRGKTGIGFYEVKIPSLCDLHPLFQVLSFAVRVIPPLYRLVKEKEIDIIHTHSQFAGMFVLITKNLFRWKIPLIYTTHSADLILNPNLLNIFKHIAEYVLFRVSDHVTTPTESIKRRLISRFGLPPSKITPIPYGIELNRISPARPSPEIENPIILYPARICKRKNQMALLEAAVSILKIIPGARFVIAGPVVDSRYFSSLKKFTKENNFSSSVEFTGELARMKIYELYRKASAVVFPTLYETQGVVIIEAMAFGVPIVASDIGPIKDVVGLREGSAILIDPQRPEELGSAIIRIIRDGKLRKEISHKSRELVCRYFSWDRITRKTTDTYEQVLLKVKSAYDKKLG
jgi:glycosyltransferase involved in cell wall biosynthesis